MFTDAASARKSASADTVAICIPTFRRNELLADCLGAVALLEAPPATRIVLIVADNDADGGAAAVCARLAAQLPWPLSCVVEPQRGLASVRNRLLHEALRAGAAWIAFLDDDERPAPDWLLRHLEALRRDQAQVSSGPVLQPETAGSAERLRRAQTRAGTTPRHVACNNVVFSSALAADQGLRFDPRFNFIGGEDFDFFEASARAGNRHLWTPAALVIETVPPERATLRYLLRRHFSGASNSVVRYRKQHGPLRAAGHFLIKSLGKLLSALGALLTLPFRGRVAAEDALKRLANAAGYLCGLVNLRIERYR